MGKAHWIARASSHMRIGVGVLYPARSIGVTTLAFLFSVEDFLGDHWYLRVAVDRATSDQSWTDVIQQRYKICHSIAGQESKGRNWRQMYPQ